MFSLAEKLKFSDEKCKILKPTWDVVTDYLVGYLVAVSLLFAYMERDVKFECRPVVNCPAVSIPYTNATLMSLSQVHHRNICEEYYSFQNAGTIEGKEVVSDIANSLHYSSFVNSECSKSATKYFLAYFPFVLFIQAFVLVIIDNLWLKLPPFASVIEHFTTLVMECYALPCPSLDLVTTIFDASVRSEKDDTAGETPNIPNDPATVSAVKCLYEKVEQLEENIQSSEKRGKVRWLYLIQAAVQVALAFAFFIIDIYYMQDLQETVTCTTTQYILVPHDYFICSHNLAPTFAWGLIHLYLPVLAIHISCSIVTFIWTALTMKKECKYDFEKEDLPKLVGAIVSDINPVKDDFGFLLHLVGWYNKAYVAKFASYLAKWNKKKIQMHILKTKWPISRLQKEMEYWEKFQKPGKLMFSKLPGIPPNVFALTSQVVILELNECGLLENQDFKDFHLLSSLKLLSMYKCGLTCIPDGIFAMKWLESLLLKENSIQSIEVKILELTNLITLDLSNNNLKNICPKLKDHPKLFRIYLQGNEELGMADFKNAQACMENNCLIVEPPFHIQKMLTS